MEILRNNIITRELYVMLSGIFPKEIIDQIIFFANLHSSQKKSLNIKFNEQIKKGKNMYRPDDTISNGAIFVLNDFIDALISKMIRYSVVLTEHMRQRTITSRTIQNVVKILTHGEYKKNLVLNGCYMVTRYNACICENGRLEKGKRISDVIGTFIGPAKVEEIMRYNINKNRSRISKGAIIYMTSVIDYITKDIIKSSKNIAGIICTENVIDAVKCNHDLKSLFHELYI